MPSNRLLQNLPTALLAVAFAAAVLAAATSTAARLSTSAPQPEGKRPSGSRPSEASAARRTPRVTSVRDIPAASTMTVGNFGARTAVEVVMVLSFR